MKYFKNEFLYLQDDLTGNQFNGTNIIIVGSTSYTKPIEVDQRKSYNITVKEIAYVNSDFEHFIEVSNDGVNFSRRLQINKIHNKATDISYVLSPLYDFKYFRLSIYNKAYGSNIAPTVYYFESEEETSFNTPKMISIKYNVPHWHYFDALGYKLDGTLFIPAYSYTESQVYDISNLKYWDVHLKQPFTFSEAYFSVWVSKDGVNFINYSGNYAVNINFLDVFISANYCENCNNYIKFVMEVTSGGASPTVIFRGINA